MNKLFDNILVSSSNEGGLFLLNEGNVFKLDNFDTTGLSVKGRRVLRGIQPSTLLLYDKGLLEITNNTVQFDDIHDVYLEDQLVYIVGTSNNEIIKLNSCGEEIKRWVFPGEKDAYHINCLTLWNDRIVFSAFGEFTEHRGYKDKTEKAGFVQDLCTGKRIITGLSQPHSLMPFGQNLLLTNSEKNELSEYRPSGELVRTLKLDGYTRGICVDSTTIYVGLSCSRNVKSNGISKATVVAINRNSWDEIGRVNLPVAEIYAIQRITNRNAMVHILANITSNTFSKLVSSVAKRDAQIANLNKNISERNVQFDFLNQTVAERDEKIELLSQTIVERDTQIDLLNAIVDESEGQIANFNQAIFERDSQIEHLNKTVAENEVQIAALLKNVEDLKSSTSWAVTYPLRFFKFRIMFIASSIIKICTSIRALLIRVALHIKLLRWYHELKHCPLFDRNWYLIHNPDISQSNINPLRHYLTSGWKENRRPGPEFDGAYYRSRYLDVAYSDQPPLLHYWRHGRHEGRHINPLFDIEWLKGNDDMQMTLRQIRTEDKQQLVKDFLYYKDIVFISVIIPTYNRIKLLPGIINSWRKVNICTPFAYEIIFSDDGSSDGTAEYLESVKDLPLRVLRNIHGGASSARNAAIKAAYGERLLIIGDDIFPDQEILNIHAKHSKEMGPKVAILGNVDWHKDLEVNHLMHHITEIGNEQFSYNRLKDGSYVDFRHFYTCNVSIDRKFLLKEKMIFNERFDAAAFEDIELGYRLSLRGLRLFYTTQAKGYHYHPYTVVDFCHRQFSAGKMAVVFSEIHPGVRQILGVDNLSRKVRKFDKSWGQDEIWQNRIDMLVRRCEEYERLAAALPKDISQNIRSCLSLIYSLLFSAMYEYGVLTNLESYSNPLSISMACNFKDSWTNYWTYLEHDGEKTIAYDTDKNFHSVQALDTSNMDNFFLRENQRLLFDEIKQLNALSHTRYIDVKNNSRIRRLFRLSIYYLTKNPSYLAYRAKQAFVGSFIRKFATVKFSSKNYISLESAIMGLIIEPNNTNRIEAIALFRDAFRDAARVYERRHDNQIIPLLNDSKKGEPISLSSAEANIFFWPTSTRSMPLRDHLLNAYMAIVENGLGIAIISNDLTIEKSVTVSSLRDHMLFCRDTGEAVINGVLGQIPFTGKILRLLPSTNSVNRQRIEVLIGTPVKLDDDGFFINSKMGAMPSICYRASYMPQRNKNKKLVFVFPIFLAVGGVERNTVEIMRKLNNSYDFVIITMERLRPEQGSLAAQAYEVAAVIIELPEIVRHSNYLSVLNRLKENLQPDLVWVCNGSPWFCDNAANIRKTFCDVPIIDQEAYDNEKGWITRYGDAGIQSFDHFIAVNKKIKERFLSDFLIDSERISLIYSAIDTQRILRFKETKPDSSSLRVKFGLPHDKKIFTFIGRLTAQKRPFSFLGLAKRRLLHNDECFVFVGDGELAPQAIDFIKRHSLINVIRISYIENTLELNAVSNGIIFTSAYEGLPIAMLEALSMGVPAFSTNVGDIADVLTEYGGGSVIPAMCSDKQMDEGFNRWLSRHEEYTTNLKIHENKILERFSSENIAKQYDSCWKKVMTKYAKASI